MRTDENGYIITKMAEGAGASAIPWDDPYPYFKGMIPKPDKPDKPIDLLNPNLSVDGIEEARSGKHQKSFSLVYT